ncbi:hypothetical protein [Spiroplasma endosymbiont of Crioceris asparagi]|uniref:hypothetical protein n=1 Tax=Spiroplasma endosymbiont of Crioceris asparagi TaxID=3066286 RepID=UPI0030D46B28
MKTINWKIIKNFILATYKNDEQFIKNNSGTIILEKVTFNKNYVAMNKYLYFVQLSLFLMYGQNILDVTFKANKNGSVVNDFFEESEMLYDGSVSFNDIDNHVKEIIIKTIDCLKQYSVEDLIEMNQYDVAWINAFKNDNDIKFENVQEKFKKYGMYQQYLKNIGLPIEESIISQVN